MPTFRQIMKRVRAAAEAVGTTAGTATKMYPDGIWVATNGASGHYSALNVPKHVSLPDLCQALHDQGLVVFSAISSFPDIRGTWHTGGARDQVCVLHHEWDEGFNFGRHARSYPMQAAPHPDAAVNLKAFY